jgi:hypothetical protein
MDSCLPSTVVFYLCIICVFLDIQYHGFVPFIIITDIFISIILIAIVNWFCTDIGIGLAWFATAGFFLTVLYGIYSWRISHPNYIGLLEVNGTPLFFLNPYNYPSQTFSPLQTYKPFK